MERCLCGQDLTSACGEMVLARCPKIEKLQGKGRPCVSTKLITFHAIGPSQSMRVLTAATRQEIHAQSSPIAYVTTLFKEVQRSTSCVRSEKEDSSDIVLLAAMYT